MKIVSSIAAAGILALAVPALAQTTPGGGAAKIHDRVHGCVEQTERRQVGQCVAGTGPWHCDRLQGRRRE